MAPPKFSLALTIAILSVWAASAAHHQAAAPSPSSSSVDCSSLILNMADCLSFVSSGSEVSKPEGSCCSGLKTVLKTDAECLCEAFKSSASLGVTLNVTKAMTLPAVCKVSAPSATNCASATAGAPTTFQGANEVAPAPAPGSSGSPVLSVSIGSLVLGLIFMLVSGY
ncbi:PREDICTED: non-specific lipid-transfer protein-like protein At5g64080 isoform X2 [Theobroma cacao]|uniref:Non-specific lipid-transfer protein-like protein At5g64080 isoform X2 n=1 Tax=Theobroma cacao TaxID=3641 RepID=A0AB32W1Q4_THECC|nr:PREDICTED: non-specific lipid-transfer protein-like protein At5g64080 isoform X2 [Theobroma cacao]